MAEQQYQPQVFKHPDGRTRRVTSIESEVKATFDGFAATDAKTPAPASTPTSNPPVAGSPEGGSDEFDPSQHTVAEVQEYLAGADDAERQRVLDAEQAGKGRQTILG